MDKEKEDAVKRLRHVFELAERGVFDNIQNLYAVRFGLDAINYADMVSGHPENKHLERYKEAMKGIPAGCFDIGQGIRALTKDNGFLDPEYNGNMDFFFIMSDVLDEFSRTDGDYTDEEMKKLHEELVKVFKRFHFYQCTEEREENV